MFYQSYKVFFFFLMVSFMFSAILHNLILYFLKKFFLQFHSRSFPVSSMFKLGHLFLTLPQFQSLYFWEKERVRFDPGSLRPPRHRANILPLDHGVLPRLIKYVLPMNAFSVLLLSCNHVLQWHWENQNKFRKQNV